MIDWRHGGWTGSLNKSVRREVREHMNTNAAAKRCRYSVPLRILRGFFAGRTFGNFVAIYVALDVLVVLAELVAARFFPASLPAWTSSHASFDIKALLTTVAGYLLSAQVGILGVIAIAIGLVTLIAQREGGPGAGTDVQLYYHESLAFEVVASSIAFLAVLCAQLLWPLQFLLHRLGEGSDLQVFKLTLVATHVAWLLLNLAGLAHFISTTFRFVQQSSREQFRERYVANVVMPNEMSRRLRHHLYENAGSELVAVDDDEIGPSISLGFNFAEVEHAEIEVVFARPMVLHDVRIIWLRWALRRWWARCQVQARGEADQRRIGGLDLDKSTLAFTLHLDAPLSGKVAWCRRRGGVPLDAVERAVIRWSFRFRRSVA
jgi:uncharacterized membrane protein